MKPIAMKCSFEQFNKIRPILEENDLAVYEESFSQYPYLTNNIGNELGVISNIHGISKDRYERKVFEEWNENVFLEYCGIKVHKEKMYDVTREQLGIIHNMVCEGWKSRIENLAQSVFTNPFINVGKLSHTQVTDIMNASSTSQKPVLQEIFPTWNDKPTLDSMKGDLVYFKENRTIMGVGMIAISFAREDAFWLNPKFNWRIEGTQLIPTLK